MRRITFDTDNDDNGDKTEHQLNTIKPNKIAAFLNEITQIRIEMEEHKKNVFFPCAVVVLLSQNVHF